MVWYEVKTSLEILQLVNSLHIKFPTKWFTISEQRYVKYFRDFLIQLILRARHPKLKEGQNTDRDREETKPTIILLQLMN